MLNMTLLVQKVCVRGKKLSKSAFGYFKTKKKKIRLLSRNLSISIVYQHNITLCYLYPYWTLKSFIYKGTMSRSAPVSLLLRWPPSPPLQLFFMKLSTQLSTGRNILFRYIPFPEISALPLTWRGGEVRP